MATPPRVWYGTAMAASAAGQSLGGAMGAEAASDVACLASTAPAQVETLPYIS